MAPEAIAGKPSISLMGGEYGILVCHSVIQRLGSPNYICILKGIDKQSIAIAPCSEKHALSYKVPENLISADRKIRIYSRDFVQELRLANGLDPAKTHRIYGEYSEKHNAVIFPLKVF